MNDSIQMAIRFTMMIAIPCAVGLGVLNSSINGLIFGATYAKGLGAAMLRIGAVSVIFLLSVNVDKWYLTGNGKDESASQTFCDFRCGQYRCIMAFINIHRL